MWLYERACKSVAYPGSQDVKPIRLWAGRINWFPATFPAVPYYFFRLRAVNQNGPALRRDIQSPPALEPNDFARLQKDCVVIDARSKESYAEGHVPGSLSNAYRDVFAIWLGWLVPADSQLLFVTDHTPIERLVDESLLV